MIAIKNKLPWWVKLGAKIVLASLPLGYSFWQKLSLFRHGRMDQSDYAFGVFSAHIERAGLMRSLAGKTILELGPGDSVATAIIAYALGARAILLDTGNYAQPSLDCYSDLINKLQSLGLDVPSIKEFRSLDELLRACNADYLTDGLDSFAEIEDESVDFIFSQAVLEHIRRRDFCSTLNECYRVLRHNGVCSHRIDLRDHLGGGLNNLRFPESVWESEVFARSGFYTNRIRFSEMLSLFKQSKFAVQICAVRRWDQLPIQRKSLAAEFSDLADDELAVSGFDVLLLKKSVLEFVD